MTRTPTHAPPPSAGTPRRATWVRSTAGLSLQVTASGAWDAELRAWAEGWDQTAGDHVLGEVDVVPVVPPPPAQPVRRLSALDLYADGGRRWAVDGTGAVAYTAGARAQVGGPATRVGAHRVMTVVLAALAEERGLHLLHAGLLRAPAGDAVLVVGDSGQGKSTVAAAAAAAGWTVDGDDLTFVRADAPAVHAAAVPARMCAPVEVVTDGAGWAPEVDKRGRRRSAQPCRPAGFSEIRAVLLVAHGTSAETQLATLEGADALTALVGGTVLAHEAGVLRRSLAWAAALARGETFVLAHGFDPARRLDGARDALARLS